jgi:two-component system, cell cycle response regulator DivK
MTTYTTQLTKVLYIEDNHINIRLVKKYLKTMGYELIVAQDGNEGLILASQEKPDVILLDMNLPSIDGMTVMRSLKTSQSTHHIPVIIFTADNSSKTEREALASGASAFLTKPISRSKLLRTLRMFTPDALATA